MAARRKRRTKSFRVPKKGQRRKTARRAFMPAARRRRRSNPVGVTQTPAFRSAAWAVGGAVAFGALSQAGIGKKFIKGDLTRAAVFAAVTLAIAGMSKKAKNKAALTSLAVGMVSVPAVQWVNTNLQLGSKLDAFLPKAGNGNGNGNGVSQETAALQRQMRARSSAYSVGMQHSRSVASGGLKTF